MPVLVNNASLPALLLPGWSLDRNFQLTLVVKATCDFNQLGNVSLSETQQPILLADEYRGQPDTSSLCQAAEIAPFKRNAEFYLYGTAYPEKPEDTSTMTTVRLQTANGLVEKQLYVLGEHRWKRSFSGIVRSKMAALEPLELQYEMAYGGYDAKQEEGVISNPSGRGYNPSRFWIRDARAPRIEYPEQFHSQLNRNGKPAGYGPLPVNWSPRIERYGQPPTKQELDRTVCPGGDNQHPQMHHSAPDDQQLPSFLQGTEQLYLSGFFPDTSSGITLSLPTLSTQVSLLQRHKPPTSYTAVCDTLVVNTDQKQFNLVFRLPLPAALLSDEDESWLVIPENFGPAFQENPDVS